MSVLMRYDFTTDTINTGDTAYNLINIYPAQLDTTQNCYHVLSNHMLYSNNTFTIPSEGLLVTFDYKYVSGAGNTWNYIFAWGSHPLMGKDSIQWPNIYLGASKDSSKYFGVDYSFASNWHTYSLLMMPDTGGYVQVVGFIDGKKVTTSDYSIRLTFSKFFISAGSNSARIEAYIKNFRIVTGPFSKNIYIDSENEGYGMSNGTFQLFTDDWSSCSDTEKITLFNQVTGDASLSDLVTLGNFKVVSYSEYNTPLSLVVIAIPKDEIVLPVSLINLKSVESVTSISITEEGYSPNSTSTAGIKYAFTTDLATYKVYNTTTLTWDVVNTSNLMAEGMTVATINSLTKDNISDFLGDNKAIGIAFVMYSDSVDDLISIDNLAITADMLGSWDKAVYGTDYKYGYSANDLLSVNLLTNGDYKINYADAQDNSVGGGDSDIGSPDIPPISPDEPIVIPTETVSLVSGDTWVVPDGIFKIAYMFYWTYKNTQYNSSIAYWTVIPGDVISVLATVESGGGQTMHAISLKVGDIVIFKTTIALSAIFKYVSIQYGTEINDI